MSRIRPILLMAFAILACAVEDQVVLRDGRVLYGRVVEESQDAIVLAWSGLRVTLERGRVSSVHRRAGRPLPADPEPSASRPPEPGRAQVRSAGGGDASWTAWIALGGGWGTGSLDGRGTVRDTMLASEMPVSTAFAGDGAVLLPGLLMRLTWEPYPRGLSPLFGAQVRSGASAGDGASMAVAGAAVLAGLAIPAGSLRLQATLNAGWAEARTKRSLDLLDGGGAVLAALDSRERLDGWTAGSELLAVRSHGPWRLAVGIGVEAARLRGTASWSSPDGRYRGSEQLACEQFVPYAIGGIGYAW